MKSTKILLLFTFAALLSACTHSGEYRLVSKTDGNGFTYQTVLNDPLTARIYTLDNGLKVYLAVNKNEPRIYTTISVRAGAKNDPAETTGLAHYFEHLMFKGTTEFGTADYAVEKPLLDSIEALYETYRNTTGEAARRAVYQEIDRVSQAAARWAIPNEYLKLMSAIGSRNSNAWTSDDATSYVEDIPANRLEDWAMIQAKRFADPVIRLFHTELETVYEEKNMSLAGDGRKVSEAVYGALFPHHPYGTQTVLGTQEHLKNPSIARIKKYWETYYVANNMAVALSGDFDPDRAMAIIHKHFGSLRSGEVPPVLQTPEAPITAPIVKEVWGNDAESVQVAFRLPAAASRDIETAEVVDYLMFIGPVHLNLTQKQQVLGAMAYVSERADHSVYLLSARPKQGQTLDEVRDLLLAQVDSLRQGNFADWLIEATINNFKLQQMERALHNEDCAWDLISGFTSGISRLDAVSALDRQSKITKEDVVAFANKYFANNYVVVYKRKGEDKNIRKIDQPHITPIDTDREAESAFLKQVKATAAEPVAPVFLQFDKDLDRAVTDTQLPLLYKKNTETGTFRLNYVFDMGRNHDKLLGMAFDYLHYLGTSQYTPEEIKAEFYKIACRFRLSAEEDRVYVSLSGLDDNFEQALVLLESLLADPQVNRAAFDNLRLDELKSRADNKLNHHYLLSALQQYAIWGARSPFTHVASAAELMQLQPEALTARVVDLKNYRHRILYYGPRPLKEVNALLSRHHAVGAAPLKDAPAPAVFTQQETPVNKVYFVHYNAPQVYLSMHSKGVPFDRSLEPVRSLYNDYFGSGANSVVFREMRESRGLAYSARAVYAGVSHPARAYYYTATIATQNDKVGEAVQAFLHLINQMPESEQSFALTKNNALANIRTERIIRDNVLWTYLHAEKMGYTYDARKDRFEQYPAMTLADIRAFQETYVKDRCYTCCILGNERDDRLMRTLAQFGEVHKLTPEELFGY